MTEALAMNHLHLPAADPEYLSNWYVEKLGFRRSGNLLWSAGTLLVFGHGEPLNKEMIHFGFRLSSAEELHNWYHTLSDRGLNPPQPEGNEEYQCFRINDPEGYELEFFFEASFV